MAQLGLHGILGVALGRAAAPAAGEKVAGRPALCWGLALGSLLPDTDFFLMLPAYLIWGGKAVGLHRGWSHSLLCALVAALLALAFARRRREAAGLALGLGLGMLLHDLTDLVLWFSPVGLLWPLRLGGAAGAPGGGGLAWLGSGRLDLWAWARVPRLVSNLLGALDYLALACYYMYLGSLARRLGGDQGFRPTLRRWSWAAWGLFGLYLVLAVLLRRGGFFDLVHYALLILVFLPVTLWVTVRMRATLEAWRRRPRGRDSLGRLTVCRVRGA